MELKPESATTASRQTHLDHEVLDAAVELGARIIPLVRENEEVFRRARRQVRVQLDVQVAVRRGQTQVRLFGRAALHALRDAVVFGFHVLRRAGEGAGGRACT